MTGANPSLAQVIRLIRDGELDGTERAIRDAFRERGDRVGRIKRNTISVHDTVVFNDKAKAKLVGLHGEVIRKNVKNLVVQIVSDPRTVALSLAGARYTCPPVILDLVEEEPRTDA